MFVQDMMKDEFGIKQLGKRLKILEAAKVEQARAPSAPKVKGKTKKSGPTPAAQKAVAGEA
eukprot:COSAG01_NODE_25607_length_739_cov_54.939062_1_plen_61_part_00